MIRNLTAIVQAGIGLAVLFVLAKVIFAAMNFDALINALTLH